LKDYPELLALTLNPIFFDLFIKKEDIKISNISKFDDFLLDIYQTNGIYDKYQAVRLELFDINKMSAERKTEISVFEELEILSQIRGINIDPKKTTLAEYEQIQILGRDKSEKQADGTGGIQ